MSSPIQTFAHGYALLIGVGQCLESQFSLPVTVKDMQALRQILVNPDLGGYPDSDRHVRLLYDQGATQSAILAGLTWLQEQATADPEATVIVYYSGHGWLETKSDRYYLIPHEFDAYEWKTTALKAEDFNHAIHQIPARRRLVILDCCHAAGMATAKASEPEPNLPRGVTSTAAPKELIDALKQGEGRIVFTSCRGDQKSWIRPDRSLSLYTHHLIEALRGAASQPGAAEVTVFDIANHLGKAVPESARAMGKEQTPRFEMAETERFAIALLQGGKGLPAEGWEAVMPQVNVPQVSVQASGERSVAIGGDVSGGTIISGDGNVVGTGNVLQQGKYNLNLQSASGLHIGDTYSSHPSKEQSEFRSGQSSDAEVSRSVRRKTILVLAVNPIDSTRLSLDQEVREIEEGLRRSRHRDLFKVEQRWAVRTSDLRRALLDVEPHIVHFCGHGTSDSESGKATDEFRKLSIVSEEMDAGGIVLEDETGKTRLVKGQALTDLFSLFKGQLDCVVLNSCYSATQADLIVQQIPIVIGMKQEIGDRAAIEFSRGFYDALGAGRSIDEAFRFGCNAIDLQSIPEHLTPVIKHRDR